MEHKLKHTKDQTKHCVHCHHEALNGSDYCARHGGNKAVIAQQKADIYNFQKTDFLHRAGELAYHPSRFSLTVELGILRSILDNYLEKMTDAKQVEKYTGVVNKQIELIDKIITKAMSLETKLQALLSKEEVAEILQQVVNCIEEYVSDPDTLTAIAIRFNEIMGNAVVQRQTDRENTLHP